MSHANNLQLIFCTPLVHNLSELHLHPSSLIEILYTPKLISDKDGRKTHPKKEKNQNDLTLCRAIVFDTS